MGVPHQKVEARASVRYRLEAPVVFTWEGQAGSRLQGEGVTRDLGVGGAYIVTPTYPPTEAAIQMEVYLRSPDPAGRLLAIVTEGRVLRVEHPRDSKARGGFAVASGGFEILGVGIESN